ncbi:MAG: hypothetical protein ACOCTH_01810 [Halodesulfurarchaeum sp.]
MKFRIGIAVLLVVLAGCSAPTPDSSTTTPEQPTETLVSGVAGEIQTVSVTGDEVIAGISLTNHNDTASTVSIAVRFVENNTHAKIGEFSLDPGTRKTLTVPLNMYGEDPENLTVQLRIDVEIVAERAVRE